MHLLLPMKKKLYVFVIVFSFFTPLFAGADEFVAGTGVYRADRDECEKTLPDLRAKLEGAGLVIVGKIECKAVEGEVEAFEPHFKASSKEQLAAETAVAGYVPSKSHCAKMLKSMLDVVADSDETVVESACVSVNIADLERDEVALQYQPMVFLLKKI